MKTMARILSFQTRSAVCRKAHCQPDTDSHTQQANEAIDA